MLRDKAQEFNFREREKGGGGREGGRKRVKEKTICLYYNKLAIAIVGKIVSIIIGGFYFQKASTLLSSRGNKAYHLNLAVSLSLVVHLLKRCIKLALRLIHTYIR